MTRGSKTTFSQNRKELTDAAKARERKLIEAGKRVQTTKRVTSAPKRRSQCVDGPRPCPFVGCRYHLFLSIQARGNIVFPFGDDPEAIFRMMHTCALDVASRETSTSNDVAKLLNVTRQRIEQEEHAAIKKLRHYAEKPDE